MQVTTVVTDYKFMAINMATKERKYIEFTLRGDLTAVQSFNEALSRLPEGWAFEASVPVMALMKFEVG